MIIRLGVLYYLIHVISYIVELTLFGCVWRWSCNSLHGSKWYYKWCWWCSDCRV